jgi:hypothetical protein
MNLVNPESLTQVLKSTKKNKGGNLTVLSKATNKEFTYRIARSEFKEKWYTQVYVETQYLQFRHLGVYREGGIFKAGQPVTSPAAKGAGWVLGNCEKGNFALVNAQAEIYHTGSCLKCGKELTDSDSIKAGLGPICRAIK